MITAGATDMTVNDDESACGKPATTQGKRKLKAEETAEAETRGCGCGTNEHGARAFTISLS